MATSRDGTKTTPYYHKEIVFADLADFDPEFADFWDEDTNKIDFQDPEANKQITKTLLKYDFDITAEFPDDRLCPPVPSRWNYVHWAQELLDTTRDDYKDVADRTRKVVGLDIGTGASAILPLLACGSRPAWHMYATDIDAKSLEHARKNVALNKLEDSITVTLTNTDDKIIPLDKLGVEQLDIVLFNPPFFVDRADMEAGYKNKVMPASTICTGSDNEMIAKGGDLGFGLRMLEESKVLKTKVKWYTLFMGKYKSVLDLVDAIKAAGIPNFAVAMFQPGKRTQRWGVGWSFGDFRPKDLVVREEELPRTTQPAHTAHTLWADGKSIRALEKILCTEIKVAEVSGAVWEWNSVTSTGLLLSHGNSWGRKARNKRKRRAEAEELAKANDKPDGASTEPKEEEKAANKKDAPPVTFAVRVTCERNKVECRWLKGKDYHTEFESFYRWLQRKVQD
ncbi:hypothetical protein MBLNU230_g5072t1 [Neophaeotheca triangularis]